MIDLSAPIMKAAAVVAAAGGIGGGALALDRMHVSAGDFEKYLEQQQLSDDRTYVKGLKEDIRNVRGALMTRPDDDYLIEELASLIDELCEMRPEDKLCEE